MGYIGCKVGCRAVCRHQALGQERHWRTEVFSQEGQQGIFVQLQHHNVAVLPTWVEVERNMFKARGSFWLEQLHIYSGTIVPEAAWVLFARSVLS